MFTLLRYLKIVNKITFLFKKAKPDRKFDFIITQLCVQVEEKSSNFAGIFVEIDEGAGEAGEVLIENL